MAASSASQTHDPKWRRRPGERPHQLIVAALEVFSEQGFTAARLDEIARRAGVSKGTIYLYFAGKDELFKAVVNDIIAAQLQEAHQAPPPRTASEGLERALRAHWAFATHPKYDGWFRILIAELPKHPDLLAFYNREVIDRGWAILESHIARGVESGEFRNIEPRLAVGLANSLVIMHRHWVSANSIRPEYRSRDRQQLIDAIVDFALAALRNPSYSRTTP
ncbi:MAG: TetR/AcrR family transcriptional regulator [Gemmatimonadaceae bacterium]|nr:TetR/AcrR family transcriptional regulator [Gemmatimonadaceae bacterium]